MNDMQLMNDIQLENSIKNDLDPEEQLFWYGRPNPKRAIMQMDSLFLLIFSIPWTAFALFWTYAAAGFRIPDFTKPGFELFFPLFGVPFIIVGLGLMSTPYRRYLKAKRTVYAITNQRILITVITPQAKSKDVILPKDIGNITVKEFADQSGDLLFSQEAYTYSRGYNRFRPVGFWGIPDVRNVERILENAFKTTD